MQCFVIEFTKLQETLLSQPFSQSGHAEMHRTYLLGLQHLILKDVRDAVPDHLQPAGAVSHHVAIPVHDVSCGDTGEVIRHSFITAARNSNPLNTHCETDCRRKVHTPSLRCKWRCSTSCYSFYKMQLSNPTPAVSQQTF